MDYEYAIYCACSTCSSGGGFTSPVNFTDAEVLAHTWHNPGCSIEDESMQPSITNAPRGSNVIVYIITAMNW